MNKHYTCPKCGEETLMALAGVSVNNYKLLEWDDAEPEWMCFHCHHILTDEEMDNCLEDD